MLERAGAHGFSYGLHGGPPIRMQWHFYGQSELPVAVQTWELPPGGFEGMHSHAGPDGALEEIYVVLEGTGRMEIDGETFEIGVGDSVLARPGTAHDLRNTGGGALKVLTIWGPPGPADFSGFGSARRAAAARAEEAR
ncbi:cupin domain-containing protein [Arthrobacter sp. I2-34]|uniref:Cupin domain-containing protein n=1 Tax=Arthrobacter hankyongi TaxID=2904801 RepID=A0ABS9LB23_9MICC|nr:cupin domain-containing protein [Arthrobacter hankyongi]MCG2623882.1 cupin domain-containing protein [Arthrobacter hankyongi]